MWSPTEKAPEKSGVFLLTLKKVGLIDSAMTSKIIDLSQELHSGIPTWSGDCGFQLKITNDYDRLFRVVDYSLFAGAGTHMDAPAHIVQGGQDVSTLNLQNLFCPLFVIDVTASVQKNPDYQILLKDILDFEKSYGKISGGGFVAAATGWDKRWGDPKSYRNVIKGTMVFPTFSAEATDLLLERKISGIGIDTLSPDGPDSGFLVHHKILGAGKVILENLTKLNQLPPTGTHIMALPLKIKGGTESPVRAVAIL